MAKPRSIVPLNPTEEAFERFSSLLPFVTDVRGEQVTFDLGSYTHLVAKENRLERIDWIEETLRNPEEIRRNFDRRYPFREIYVNTVYESAEEVSGEYFLVIVERGIGLYFWTAFPTDEIYLRQVKRGRLLWTAEGR